MTRKIFYPFILLIALCAISLSIHAQDFGEEGDPGGDLPPVTVTPDPCADGSCMPPVTVTPPPSDPPPDPAPTIPPPDPCSLNPCSCFPSVCETSPCQQNPCSCSPACNAAPPPPSGSTPPITVPAGNNKPMLEDPNKCEGIQNMWNAVTAATSNPEGFGYITQDGQFIFTATTASQGGQVGTLYPYTSNGVTTYYYSHPMSQGPPAGNYAGIKNNGTNYFIPVVATVHTHNECKVDHTNGIDQTVSASDAALANAYPALRDYVIGCGAVGSYGAGDDSYTVQNGTPTSACGFFH